MVQCTSEKVAMHKKSLSAPYWSLRLSQTVTEPRTRTRRIGWNELEYHYRRGERLRLLLAQTGEDFVLLEN